MSGSAVALGGKLRLTATLYNASSGQPLGRARVGGSRDSVMALADHLTRRILELLLERSGERFPSVDLKSITTASLPALKAFLSGEQHFRGGEYKAATRDYEMAIRQDSTFALAHARFVPAYYWSGRQAEAKQDRAASRAYELSERLPERQRRIARAQYLWQNEERYREAARVLRQLSKEYPDDATVWYYLGEILFHRPVPRGLPEADEAFQQTIRLDPDVAPYHHHLVELAFSLHRDSTLAAQRIAAHPSGDFEEVYGVALKLVFGGDETREEALTQVGSLNHACILDYTLWHPRDGALRQRVLRQLTETSPYQNYFASLLVASSFERGEITKGLAQLTKRPLSAREATCLLAGALSLGAPLPEETLRTHMEPSLLGEDVGLAQLVCAGIYLAE